MTEISEETKKALEGVITRQEEILNGSPWNLRDKLRDLNKRLKEYIGTKI